MGCEIVEANVHLRRPHGIGKGTAARNDDGLARDFIERLQPSRQERGRSQTAADLDDEGPLARDGRCQFRALSVLTESELRLYNFVSDAFSSREPISTSLENASTARKAGEDLMHARRGGGALAMDFNADAALDHIELFDPHSDRDDGAVREQRRGDLFR